MSRTPHCTDALSRSRNPLSAIAQSMFAKLYHVSPPSDSSLSTSYAGMSALRRRSARSALLAASCGAALRRLFLGSSAQGQHWSHVMESGHWKTLILNVVQQSKKLCGWSYPSSASMPRLTSDPPMSWARVWPDPSPSRWPCSQYAQPTRTAIFPQDRADPCPTSSSSSCGLFRMIAGRSAAGSATRRAIIRPHSSCRDRLRSGGHTLRATGYPIGCICKSALQHASVQCARISGSEWQREQS